VHLIQIYFFFLFKGLLFWLHKNGRWHFDHLNHYYICAMKKIRIAVFASGSGSNALNLMKFFSNHSFVEMAFVLSNRKEAPIVERCKEIGASVEIINNEMAEQSEVLIALCEKSNVDFVVLAGYLRKIPAGFIQHYPSKIINIHPALLPAYGGPGMYGKNVHNAVLQNKEKQSGITVHFVNENYDEGAYIAQFHCSINENDNLPSLQNKIQLLEHDYFPVVVEKTIKNTFL
jgi:phosphoribosylglycinamide formyltransferase-1